MRAAAASNRPLPSFVLEMLSDDAEPRVAAALAAGCAARGFSGEEAEALRRLFEAHPKTKAVVSKGRRPLPEAILRILARDPNPNVRAEIAGRPDACVRILARAAGDPEAAVRRAAAGNPNATDGMLLQMAWGSDFGILWAVRRRRLPAATLSIAAFGGETKRTAMRDLSTLSRHEALEAYSLLARRHPERAAAAKSVLAELAFAETPA